MITATPLLNALNEAQRELLQLFAGGLTEPQMQELRRLLLDFKFRRVTALADQFADDRGWGTSEMAEDAQTIQRRPYRPEPPLASA